MSKIAPPFRADHVGSLLRTPAIHAAKADFHAGKIDAERAARRRGRRDRRDDAPARRHRHPRDHRRRVPARLVPPRLPPAARRDHDRRHDRGDVRLGGDGPPGAAAHHGDRQAHPRPPDPGRRLRVRRRPTPPTACTPKVAIPSPTMAHFRGGRAGIDIQSYPDLDEFFDDLAQAYRDEIAALYAAGCRYIQLDDTNLAYLCDPGMRQGAIDRGDDPDELPRTYAALINAALDGRPDDLDRRRPPVPRQLPQHPLRLRRLRAGGRGAVQRARPSTPTSSSTTTSAPAASRRCGSCPKDKTVVLGLITSKHPELEPVDDVRGAHRRGGAVRRTRPALPEPAVRIRLDDPRQRDDPRPAVGQAAPRRRHRRPRLALTRPMLPPAGRAPRTRDRARPRRVGRRMVVDAGAPAARGVGPDRPQRVA